MTPSSTSDLPQPTSSKNVIRILLGVIVVLTYLAGYYHSLWQIEAQRNMSLYTSNEEQQQEE